MSKARDEAMALVTSEMDRTDEQFGGEGRTPTRDDYIADIVRYLNNQLHRRDQFFESDYAADDPL